MGYIRVADVQDGACAAVFDHRDRLSVILDCGSQQGSGLASAGLRRIVGLPEDGETAVVVSHIHADHFNGFGSLPAGSFEHLTLVQPALPFLPVNRLFLEDHAALQLRLGVVSSVGHLNVESIVAKLGRGKTRTRYVARGDRFFAHGQAWDVLWPPRTLASGQATKAMESAIEGFDRVAGKDPLLEEAVRHVRGGRFRLRRPEATTSTAWQGDEELGEAPFGYDETGESHEDGLDLHGAPVVPLHPIKPDLADDFRSVVRRFRSLSNYMSLAVATVGGGLVAWGDVPLTTAEWAATHPFAALPCCGRTPDGHWRVVLAPHHGSHGALSDEIHGDFCVSSNGPKLHGLWHANHEVAMRQHHHEPHRPCLSTAGAGDIARYLWYW